MKKMPNKVLCPHCKKEFSSKTSSNTFPFCCERCRNADLGRWFLEDYRIASEEAPPIPSEDGDTADNNDCD